MMSYLCGGEKSAGVEGGHCTLNYISVPKALSNNLMYNIFGTSPCFALGAQITPDPYF